MALFTMVMGNSFAAFPVMTGGVGVPILVGIFHGNPATMAAIGMFSDYCGTLMTPMAANFNIVPAALLELPDKNAVIRVQVLTALTLLVANIFLAELVNVYLSAPSRVLATSSASVCRSGALQSRIRSRDCTPHTAPQWLPRAASSPSVTDQTSKGSLIWKITAM